jgi:hypothetical protein
LAHRVSYFLATGIDPAEKVVCHTCDNPICVNPAHLFAGTRLDNNRDMFRKGRGRPRGGVYPKGENHHAAKGSDADVLRAIDLRRSGRVPVKALAAQFGVSLPTMKRWLSGKRQLSGVAQKTAQKQRFTENG